LEKLKQKLSDYLKQQKNITNILGCFELQEQLGQGGTSIVRAVSLNGNSNYAIKFLIENIKEKESRAYLRFKQAYINILSIQHTGVVLPQIHFDILEIDQETIIPYSIMLKAEKTLKDIINKNEMTFETFENIFKNLIKAINIIHKYKIIHRDLKPENIFYFDKKLVLGDFDIAKFNDIEHIKLHETKKGERLANYQFSAPEQSTMKFDEIDERADLFALGQILYWIITKTTLRGQENINLKKYDFRYEKYEELIDNLLQNEREKRLVNVDEINNFLEQKNKFNQEQKEISDSFKTLKLFEEIIDKYTHDKSYRSFKKIDDIKIINQIMNDLSKEFKEMKLCWSQGLPNNEVEKIEKLESLSILNKCKDKFIKNTKWLLDDYEFDIKSIWIYKYDIGGSIIILETEPLTSFGIYGKKYKTEEVAIFKNKYIPKVHYDNGWTEINGKKIKIDFPCETRIRHLYNDLFFIVPFDGSIIGNNKERTELILDDIVEKYKEGAILNEELLSPLMDFRKKPKIALWS
jgi:serine/threonine-protein kinase